MAARDKGRPSGTYTQGARLLRLYDRLHRGDRLNARDVADNLGTTRRTIERDLAELKRVLGEALRREVLPDTRVAYWMPSAERQWSVTRWQVLAIATGARLTGFLSGDRFAPHAAPMVEQMRGSLRPGERMAVERLEQKIHVVGRGQKDYLANPALLDRLSTMIDALLLERPVDLRYRSPKMKAAGLPGRRLVVHPLCLTLYREGVYFVVEVVEGEWRGPSRILLMLDRVTEATIGKERFDLPDFDPAEFFATAFGIRPGDERHSVVIEVSAWYATYVRERLWHQTQHVEERDDGSLRLSFEVGHLQEVVGWVLSMGRHVEALEPPQLRAAIRSELDEMAGRYRGAT